MCSIKKYSVTVMSDTEFLINFNADFTILLIMALEPYVPKKSQMTKVFWCRLTYPAPDKCVVIKW